MNKVILLVPFVICALSAHADEIKFPRVYGNDIADPVSWGGTLPGTTDTIVFTGGDTSGASGNTNILRIETIP